MTAKETARKGALQALVPSKSGLSRVQSLLADSGYMGQPFAQGVQEYPSGKPHLESSLTLKDACVRLSTRGHMDTNITHPPAGRQRRRHSPEFRAAVIQACLQPGVSIAAVALANGLNANMVRKWVIEEHKRSLPAKTHSSRPVSVPDRGSPPAPAFVPLALPAPSATSGAIQIELRRGEATVSVSWPVSAAGECAAWLQEWLQ